MMMSEWPRSTSSGARRGLGSRRTQRICTAKCWNLERVIQTQLLGEKAPETEDFESFLQEVMVLDGKIKTSD